MKYFSITFDGVYKDTADIVLPILRQYSLKATFFITTGFLDSELEGHKVVDKSYIKRILAEGHEIGAHSVTHALLKQGPIKKFIDLSKRAVAVRSFWRVMRGVTLTKINKAISTERTNRISASEYTREALSSKRTLEKICGISLKSYAYPGGRYTRGITGVMQKIGFESSRTTVEGINSKRTNPFALRSFVWTKGTGIEYFKAYLDKINEDNWGIEVFHGVGSKDSGEYGISEELFKWHCKLLASKESAVDVVTQSKGAELIYGRRT